VTSFLPFRFRTVGDRGNILSDAAFAQGTGENAMDQPVKVEAGLTRQTGDSPF